MNKIVIAISALIVLVGCSDDQKNIGRRINAQNAGLRQFKNCRAIDRARTYSATNAHVSIDSMPEGVIATADSSGRSSIGDTNVQVDGVDELDTTKADGNFIYRLTSNYRGDNFLIVLRRAPADAVGIIQKINLGISIPKGIFLTLKKAVVLSGARGNEAGQTVLISFDRNVDGTLSKTIERKVDGYLDTARLVNSNLHLIVNRYIGGVVEGDSGEDPIDNLLPNIYYNDQKVETAGCSAIWREQAIEDSINGVESGLDSLTGLLSYDMDNDDSTLHSQWIAVSYTSAVYASGENIFLASGNWYDGTPVHQFKLLNDSTKYIGTALVNGYPINQFSMDEFDNYFRIAVTDVSEQTPVDCGDADICASVGTTSNSLFTYKLTSFGPKLAGELRGFGEDEQIYAVRFMQDRAFVVTFRRTDPVFAIDLQNQEHPVLKGELKIPGFSRYLHPMNSEYLLSIGSSADSKGNVTGLALSIFDVRKLSEPKLVHKIKIGKLGTFSEASNDHHAFRFIPETQQLVIPVEQYRSYGYQTSAEFQLYDVSIPNGFTLLGRSSIAVDGYTNGQCRAFYADGVISMVSDDKMVLRNSASPAIDVTQINLQ